MRALLFLLCAAFAAAAIDFSAIPDKSWAFCSTAPGHVYGLSEVPWCYDPYHKKFVRIGGCTGGYTNEVYAYWFDGSGNFVSDQILAPGTTDNNRPGAGCSRGICYDTKRHLVWGLGGIGSPPIACSGTNNALMGLDLADNSWQKAPGSTVNYFGACVQIEYGEDPDAVVMITDGTGWHQCWVYEFSKSAWRQVATEWDPTKAGPKQGIFLAYKEMCYDPVNKLFVLYPGPGANPETWVFNPSTMTDWERRTPSPTPPFRERYGMAYDSYNKKLILHGGWRGSWDVRVCMTDTWAYDAAANTWTLISDAGASRSAGGQTNFTPFEYDSEHNAFVGLCMNEETGTWVYRLSSRGAAPEFSMPGPREVLSVFPNPFAARTQFSFPSPGTLSIFALDGRLVESLGLTRSGKGFFAVWNARGRTPGCYIASVRADKRNYSQRVEYLDK